MKCMSDMFLQISKRYAKEAQKCLENEICYMSIAASYSAVHYFLYYAFGDKKTDEELKKLLGEFYEDLEWLRLARNAVIHPMEPWRIEKVNGVHIFKENNHTRPITQKEIYREIATYPDLKSDAETAVKKMKFIFYLYGNPIGEMTIEEFKEWRDKCTK